MDKTHRVWRGSISCLWWGIGKVWLATECKQEHLCKFLWWESKNSRLIDKDSLCSEDVQWGSVGHECWTTWERKPLRYFKSWPQTHRYGGTYGALPLDFGKRQLPTLSGKKNSERLTERRFKFASVLWVDFPCRRYGPQASARGERISSHRGPVSAMCSSATRPEPELDLAETGRWCVQWKAGGKEELKRIEMKSK